VPSSPDRLTTALTSLLRSNLNTTSPAPPNSPTSLDPPPSTATSPTSDPATSPHLSSPHRLAAADIRRECNHREPVECNHWELADELEKIADELLLFSNRLRRYDRAEIEKQIERQANPRPRPIHVEVDHAAWEHLRSELTRQNQGFGYAIGALVRAAIGRPRLVQGHVALDAAQPGRRAGVYLRVSDIDDRTWSAFKAMAYTQCVTVARLVGILIEREANRVGWDREEAE
jgi:hypothetical protein